MTHVKRASPQRIFGEMIQFAIPVLSDFYSDLYHDAIAMARLSEGPDDLGYTELRHPFLWLIGHNGSHLYWLDDASSPSTVEKLAETYPHIHFYDGYTLAPIPLSEAITATRAVRSLK